MKIERIVDVLVGIVFALYIVDRFINLLHVQFGGGVLDAFNKADAAILVLVALRISWQLFFGTGEDV